MFTKKDSSPNIWMSFTDLLLSGLIVFMLISFVSYNKMNNAVNEKKDATKKADSINEINIRLLGDSKQFTDSLIIIINTITKENDTLKGELVTLQSEEDTKNGTGRNVDFGFKKGDSTKIAGVIITEDGKIRFTNFELFTSSSHQLTNELKDGLDMIWPRVIKKVEDLKNHDQNVWEIRIEGHTDSRPLPKEQGNLGLSQRRAAQTWIYINDHLMNNISTQDKEYIQERIVTLGFGSRKPLNEQGQLIKIEGGTESQDLSRRIEISLLSKPKSEQ